MEALAGLSDPQANQILYDWRGFWARPNQLMPGTPGAAQARKDWRYWMLQAGRGFGKTRTGAEAVREAVANGYRRIHLVGPTAADARDVMVQGESGLLSCFPPSQRPIYEPSKRMITFHTGAVAYTFSAEEPERLRGPQCEFGWCDEIAAWAYPEAWDQFVFGLRLGKDPRAVITSTPKPVKLVRELVKHPATIVTRGNTYDNRSNLAAGWFADIITKYEGTRLGRQELMGELLEDLPGALWTRALIEAGRCDLSQVPQLVRIVIPIDPAVTANEDSDETGIGVIGLGVNGHAYVFQDLSLRGSPLEWARIAILAFAHNRADRIVAEVNNGGDLVASNVWACATLMETEAGKAPASIASSIPVRSVRATRGKATRAEPAAALYEQGRVHHVRGRNLEALEDQLCSWVPGVTEKSPDRMDWLVWGLYDLIIQPAEEKLRMTHHDPVTISRY